MLIKDRDVILTKYGKKICSNIYYKESPNEEINLQSPNKETKEFIKFQKITHRIINSHINFN